MKKFITPSLIMLALLLNFPKATAQSFPREQLAKKSKILWDSFDVPHIYAASSPALGYGFGWAQMKSYGNEILKLYGLARGRGAEYWGEEYFPSDRLMHQVNIPDAAMEAFNNNLLS